MVKNVTAFLLAALVVITSTVGAQDHKPVSSITTATLDEYRDQYQRSPLCSKNEITLWTCEKNRRLFSLCSSTAATRTTGYLQYRASDAGKVTFVYPATKAPPSGLFQYNSFGNGNASVEFTNKGYNYTLMDPLRDHSSILVSASGSPTKATEIVCGSNQSLQGNYTMRLMYDFGIWLDD